MGEAVAVAVPAPSPQKKIIQLSWLRLEAFCGDKIMLRGETQNYPDGEELSGKIVNKGSSKPIATFKVKVQADVFLYEWEFKDLLPKQSGKNYLDKRELIAKVQGKKTPDPLVARFIPTAARHPYNVGRSHFALSANNHVAELNSDIEYIKGWGGSVVHLGAFAPPGTGGVIAGFTWADYRWMKQGNTGPVFWDGAAWQSFPPGFFLQDSNNFCVGFYKDGNDFRCQYGGTWPEKFRDWNVQAARHQKKINRWKKNIEKVWSSKHHKIGLKRKTCPSTRKVCCRYKIKAKVEFPQKAAFTAGMLVIAPGNIRSNDSLWFLGEPRIAVAAHEFGHHIGNPDEYLGAQVDASLNSDGAVNGIDANSIMGQNLTTVKKRHFRTVATHFADVVRNAVTKVYTYEAVDL